MSAMLTAFLCIAVFYFVVAVLVPVHAAEGDSGDATVDVALGITPIEREIALASTDIRLIVAKVIRVALGFLGIVSVAMVAYAGFLWMTAGGNEEQIGKARLLLRNWVIGLIIIFSALAITQFIIRGLGVASGLQYTPDERGAAPLPPYYTGALGSIIQDHYPERNARNVPRNARIMVTFVESMDPATIIADVNGPGGGPNGIFGDCVEAFLEGGPRYVCDAIRPDAVAIFESATAGAQPLAAVEAMMTEDARTFVFRPVAPLGNSLEPVNYTVNLGSGIRRADGATAFSGVIPFYEWSFEVGTTLDESPPFVTRFSPGPDTARVAKNRLAQISFNEPMDPTFLSGSTGSLPFVAVVSGPIPGGGVLRTPAMSALPTRVPGTFKMSNGYRTITFTPDEQCGENACGNPVYCLPGDAMLAFLFYTAPVKPGTRAEALPFSGVIDAAGNALDGRGRSAAEQATGETGKERADGPPAAARRLATGRPDPADDGEWGADNFYWLFGTTAELDLTPPKVTFLAPNIAEGNIGRAVSSTVIFNEEMSYESFERVGGDGKRNARLTGEFSDARTWGYLVRMCEVPAGATACTDVPPGVPGTTALRILSAEEMGGSEALDIMFASHVASDITDMAQNCFYPAVTEYPRTVNPATGAEDAACGEPIAGVGRIGGRPSCCNGLPTDAPGCGLD